MSDMAEEMDEQTLPTAGADAAGSGVPLAPESYPGGNDEDHQSDLAISNILRTGVIFSTLVVLIGMLLVFAQHADQHPQYQVFHGQPRDLSSIQGIVRSAAALQPEGTAQLGVLLLLLTPIVRVGFSMLAFLKQRDWIYVGVSSFVFVVLMYSLLGDTN